MTNAQKWVTAVLLLFFVLLVIGYLTENTEDNYIEQFSEQTTTELNKSAEQIYIDADCASCHGENLEGTEMAPKLERLSEKWSRSELISYLRNADDFKSDERIKIYKEKFSGSFMPSYNNMDIKEIGKLAEFLLKK